MNTAKDDGLGSAVSTEVRSLVERRSTLREWIANLDKLGSKYRPVVTDRVRADYQARLDAASAELESHRKAIESALADCRLVKDELDERLDGKSAEIEEAELRFQIGELDESTWTKQRDESKKSLEDIKAEQDIAAAAVLELGGVMADLDGMNGEAILHGRKPMPKPETELEPVVELPKEPAIEPVIDPVIEQVADAEPTAKDAPVPDVGSVEETGDDEFLDDLEFLESLSLDDADSFDAVSRMLDDEETTGNGNSGRADL